MIRIFAFLLGSLFLAACTEQTLEGPMVPLGDFSLGHNIVIASKMQQGPVSRDATEEEWVAVMQKAVDDRFGRYEGEQLYHFGVSVEGFMLAPGGIPILYSPKSILIINVTLWDDIGGRKLNEAPHQITVLETGDSSSALLGSGLSRTKEEQMAGLAFNAVRAIEDWMVIQSEEFGWFTEDERVAPKGSETPQKVLIGRDES